VEENARPKQDVVSGPFELPTGVGSARASSYSLTRRDGARHARELSKIQKGRACGRREDAMVNVVNDTALRIAGRLGAEERAVTAGI
jgi:hypothetical protein